MANNNSGLWSGYDPAAALNPSAAATPPAGGGLFGNSEALQNIMLGLALIGDSRPQVNPPPTTALLAPMLRLWSEQSHNKQLQQFFEEGKKAFKNGPPLDFLGGDDAPAAAPSSAPGGLLANPSGNSGGLTPGGALRNVSDPRGLVPFIRQEAVKNGIDPDTAVKVAQSEGLGTFLGDGGKSGGAFQLYTGGGEGNNFQQTTGLDPLDPKNEKATISYALQRAAQTGWTPWHGAKKIGLGQWDGIMGAPGSQTASNAMPIPTQAQGQAIPIPTQGAARVQLASATPQTMNDASPAAGPGFGAPSGDKATILAQYTPQELAAYRARGMIGPSGIPTVPPGAANINSSGQPYSPSLQTMSPQEKANDQASYASLGGDTSARGVPLPPAAPPAPAGTQLAQAQPAATPAPAPTMQDVAKARAVMQTTPPPAPNTVPGATTQRAAALRYFEYYGNVVQTFAPLGDVGKGFVEAAKARMDLAKEFLTEEQKKRLELKYGAAIAGSKTTAEHAAALPFIAPEAQAKAAGERSVTEQSDMRLQQFKTDQEIRQALANQGMMYDGNGRIVRIPYWSESNAANKGAEAGSIATAQLGPKLTEAQVAAKLARENMLAKEGISETSLPGGGVRQEPIPGGAAAMSQATQQAQKGLQSALVDRAINRAMDLSSHWTTGALGSATKSIPGLPAHDLAQTLDTLKAQSTFENLSQMRQASPTGGALGAVSDFENRLLGAAWTNLQQSQSKGQFESNLRTLKQAFDYTVNGVPDLREKLQRGEITRDQYHRELQNRLGLAPASDAQPGQPGVTPLGNTWKLK